VVFCIQAGWDDVPHLTAKAKKDMLDAYPEHERDARSKGVPMLGSGAVFPIDEKRITCDPREIQRDWVQIIGLDFGWDHPTAAARLAWDRDADCIYVTNVYRRSKEIPVVHAAAIKAWGDWIPVAWPHDGLQHDKGSGATLADQYRTAGLKMLPEKAEHADGGNGVEAGIMEMMERMRTDRFKVFKTCTEWFDEFRMYHRKDGQIVKEIDDAISASRYAVMMRREAITKPNNKPLAYARKAYT
jgi:hypothetical protein